MNRFRVVTKSGSVYVFDNVRLEWERVNANPGHENILYVDGNKGRLRYPVDAIVGDSIYFEPTGMPGVTYIRTTPVVNVEPILG